jgi:hypothetical protein
VLRQFFNNYLAEALVSELVGAATHLQSIRRPPRMMTLSTQIDWDSDGNLLIPRHGIRIAMSLALLIAAVWWMLTFLMDRELHKLSPSEPGIFPDSLWITILWIALPFVPFILSGWLLSCRSENAIAAGSGVAAGLFLCSLLFSITAVLAPAFSFWPMPYTMPRAFLSLTFSACSVWIIISAFRIANKAGWGVFFLSVTATLLVLTSAYHLLGGH